MNDRKCFPFEYMFVLVAGLVLLLLGGALPSRLLADDATSGASKSDVKTIAVLPFIPLDGSDTTFADRMRFAVSAKVGRETEYSKISDHDVDDMVSALQIPWTSPPSDSDLHNLLSQMDSYYTIYGATNGRTLTLVLYQGIAQAKTVSEDIPPDDTSPRLTLEDMLTKLMGINFNHVRDWQADHSHPAIEKLFAERPNICIDPDFSYGARRGGADPHWQGIYMSDIYSLPLVSADGGAGLTQDRMVVAPASASGVPGSTGYCLMARPSLNAAQNNGLACESDWIPIIDHHTYRFSCYYHSTGPLLRIFLKGFTFVKDDFYDPNNVASSRREFYRCQVLPVGANKGWDLVEMDFTPAALKPDIKIQWLRVDFFTYLNTGDMFVRDVVLKDITPDAAH